MDRKPQKDIKVKFPERLRKNLGYVVMFLSIMLMFSFFQSIQRSRSAGERIDNLKTRVSELESRKTDLERQVQESKSEEFVETELRTKLGLAKENEIVIILPEDEIVRKFAPKREVYEESLPDPNWKKWLDLFL